MTIGKQDVLWSYGATFLKVASGLLLLPLILRYLSSDEVGLWTVFITISSLVGLLDFGFNPTFTRNVSYVFSGVSSLKSKGLEQVLYSSVTIDYTLLKGLITAMRWFYLRMSIVLLLLLSTVGSYYIFMLLKKYSGEHGRIYFAWGVLCLVMAYNLFTQYFDSLLQGRGLIRTSKQIAIVGQLTYMSVAIIVIILGYGLISIVLGQAISVVVIRFLSYRSFFDTETKNKLICVESRSVSEVLKVIYPNAFKIGITTLSGFLVQRSAIVIGSLYLTLSEIASYGISMQVIAVLSGLASIYTSTYQPKLAQLVVQNDKEQVKRLYIQGQYILMGTFVFGGFILLLMYDPLLVMIHSQTKLMTPSLLLLALFLSLEQSNLIIAGGILLLKNEVPFLKAALISGISVVIGLLISFRYFDYGLIIMLLVPLLVDIAYQAWKWPLEVIKELQISKRDMIGVAIKIREKVI